MRLSIRHETTYRYDTPATYAIQTLRLTPRSHEGQPSRPGADIQHHLFRKIDQVGKLGRVPL